MPLFGKRKRSSAPPSALKRRKPGPPLETIAFDPSARQEYLTGFHKRKQARIKHGKDMALKRAREEKISARKMMRDERKGELEERMKVMNARMNSIEGGEQQSDVGDDGESAGLEAVEAEPDRNAEYIDEDKYTSVVVEDVNIDRDGFHNVQDGEGEGDVEIMVDQPADGKKSIKVHTNEKRSDGKKARSTAAKAKKKRKRPAYESKAERKQTKQKQGAKNSIEKARRKKLE